jgi:hypothetical protein
MGFYPHTVTLYNATGEDAQGRATYHRTVLSGTRVERRSGALATLNGSQAGDGTVLYVPGWTSGYVEPRAFSAAGWTLRPGDVFAIGICPDEVPAGATMREVQASYETHTITGIERLDRPYSARVHHFEVAAS